MRLHVAVIHDQKSASRETEALLTSVWNEVDIAFHNGCGAWIERLSDSGEAPLPDLIILDWADPARRFDHLIRFLAEDVSTSRIPVVLFKCPDGPNHISASVRDYVQAIFEHPLRPEVGHELQQIVACTLMGLAPYQDWARPGMGLVDVAPLAAADLPPRHRAEQ